MAAELLKNCGSLHAAFDFIPGIEQHAARSFSIFNTARKLFWLFDSDQLAAFKPVRIVKLPSKDSLLRDEVSIHSTIPQLPSAPASPVVPPRVPVIGIVGGVGAGKSSVVRSVSSLNLQVIDADQIGHDLLNTESIRQKILEEFGEQSLDSSGLVSRPYLASLVFGESAEKHQNRLQLNAITHPAIRDEMRRQIRSAPQDVDAIIVDAALLLEAGWADECDAVIFIDSTLEQRQQRVAETRGWSADEHRRREESQISLEEKRRRSQFVVNNSTTPEAAANQLEHVLLMIIGEYQRSQMKGT